MTDEPPSDSEWQRRALAASRLIYAALALDEAFELRRTYEDAPVVRQFVLACQVVRDLDRPDDT